jgi:hypothetical protein
MVSAALSMCLIDRYLLPGNWEKKKNQESHEIVHKSGCHWEQRLAKFEHMEQWVFLLWEVIWALVIFGHLGAAFNASHLLPREATLSLLWALWACLWDEFANGLEGGDHLLRLQQSVIMKHRPSRSHNLARQSRTGKCALDSHGLKWHTSQSCPGHKRVDSSKNEMCILFIVCHLMRIQSQNSRTVLNKRKKHKPGHKQGLFARKKA